LWNLKEEEKSEMARRVVPIKMGRMPTRVRIRIGIEKLIVLRMKEYLAE